MIELVNLTGGYEKSAKIKNVSAIFKKGEITAIIGPNGCGKSTLLKLMAGLLLPFSGSVLLNNLAISKFTRKEFARRLSLLPQSRKTPTMCVESLVYHGRFPYLPYPRRYSERDRTIVTRALELTGMTQHRHAAIGALSGGERQKAYLAMLIAQDTPVILLDEPTTYLDVNYQLELLELIAALKDSGKTIVIVLHDLNLALRYADKIIVLHKGELRYCGISQALCQTGILSEVFGIQAQMINSPFGKHYVFAPQKK